MITITHGTSTSALPLPLSLPVAGLANPAVDTSTGVLSPATHISSLVKKHSPSTLIVLDAVCAVASEEIRFDDWGLDMVISATQKGLGTPPGLSLCVISKRAVETLAARKTPVPSYYISWNKWLPVMKAYEEGRPMYFATRKSRASSANVIGKAQLIH
jgi:alanine-glyoxylate transaminase/serine-glyoxylate transaminase/serine-pyruvate transaminase